MPSLLPQFEYDVFISYRQNDNKYDGWVTEFVNNLNKELEATLKDKVTVYFDSNPHDGLLETHSVSHSLEEKLKCLIFIPILSKTYCDVKSFAWNNELLPFVEKAKQDQFGLNIKLNSGNVSSRILPVRIHDLDPEDVKLAESVIGFIRSVDFIYHSPGVNRSLRPWDDDVIKNTKQPFYRDQINKVANAIDELIRGMKQPSRRENVEKITSPVTTPVAEDRLNRSKSISQPGSKKPAWITFAVVLIGAFLFFGFRWYSNKQKVDHARMVLLPAIEKLTEENFRPPTEAFDKAVEARKVISSDSAMQNLWTKVATVTPIRTEPEGVEIFWKEYSNHDMPWRSAGVSPIAGAAFPRGYLRMEFRKEGFQTIEYAGPFGFERLGRDIDTLRLDPVGTLPENMVRFPSKRTDVFLVGVDAYGPKMIGEFLMDRFEVTNKQFKAFIDAGGYSNSSYWSQSFYANGKQIKFDDAVKSFVDQTGRPGPSSWEGGNYPDGEADHPVSGVSWYEASAYATWAKKRLPTIFHWTAAAETSRTEFIVPLSNFNGKGTTVVGSSPGYSTFGIYDIAGNVREWCSNDTESEDLRFILGGGWNDETYSFNDAYKQSSMDRGAANGFRCIRELAGDNTSKDLDIMVKMDIRDYRKEKPVDDKTFEIFLRQFAYDKIPLRDSVQPFYSNEYCTVEKITFEAGYNNERMQAYIFLPKNAKPPFQPVLFFGGSQDIFLMKFDVLFPLSRIDFLIKNGRAVVMPVFKGTLERFDALKSDLQEETVFYKDHVIMWRKDIGRTIDYLETRKDIQVDKLAFLGWSWGGFMGGIMPAIEKRIKVVVLNVGGMEMHKALPEADQLNFIPRVTQPVLMLNGKHDLFFPVESSQKPMFALLGTPAKDKKIVVYEAGHLVPRKELVRESLPWLDKYLGPPN